MFISGVTLIMADTWFNVSQPHRTIYLKKNNFDDINPKWEILFHF